VPKKIVPALIAGLLLLTTACSSGETPTPSGSETPTGSATPTAEIPTVDNLDAVKVEGKIGEDPKVEFTAPMAVATPMNKIIEEGKGHKLEGTEYIYLNYLGINARTGNEFDGTWADPNASASETAADPSASPSPTPTAAVKRETTPTIFGLSELIPGFAKAIKGVPVGSRVLLGIPSSEAYDSQGGVASIDIKVGDSLFFVVDVLDASYAQATGKETTGNEWADKLGYKVEDGVPSLTIPEGTAAPEKMVAETLIEGESSSTIPDASKEENASGTILTNFKAYSLKTGQEVTAWTKNDIGVLAKAIPGWISGLKDKKIGSRVLLVLPPEDGFPEGSNDPALEAGDTIVYIVDILWYM
jgi:peptidylprolyl isomerase